VAGVNIYGLRCWLGLTDRDREIGTLVPWYLILLLIEVNAAAFSIRTMGERKILMLLCPSFGVSTASCST